MTTSLKVFLTDWRLSNYGYEPRAFRKMSSLKTSLARKIRNMDESTIEARLADINRLHKEGGEWDYTTGQSQNEEMLNLMYTAVHNKGIWDTKLWERMWEN